jgi:hypothetical protein
VQDRGNNEDDKEHRERDRGKKPCRIPDKQEKECTCNQIILVGDRPFCPPVLPEPPFEETLDQVPEECTGCKQGDGQECMSRQAGVRVLSGTPDQDKPGGNAGKNPDDEATVGFPVPENPVTVRIIPPKIDRCASAGQIQNAQIIGMKINSILIMKHSNTCNKEQMQTLRLLNS